VFIASLPKGFLPPNLLVEAFLPALEHAEQTTSLLFIFSGLYLCSTTRYYYIRLIGTRWREALVARIECLKRELTSRLTKAL
jgi:hypothetical protein